LIIQDLNGFAAQPDRLQTSLIGKIKATRPIIARCEVKGDSGLNTKQNQFVIDFPAIFR
jgi:hypothetical protein